MSTPKAIIGLCLIFFLGIVTGIALSVRITDARIRQLTTGGPEVLADMVVRRLGRQLELTPVQREQLYAITKKTSEEILRESIGSRPISPEGLIEDESIAKIRAILTPEQAPKFDAILAKNKRGATIGEPIFKIPKPEGAK